MRCIPVVMGNTYQVNADVDELSDPNFDEMYAAVDDGDYQPLTESASETEFYAELSERVLKFCELLSDVQLHPYQRGLGLRIIDSVIRGDASELTALWCRQSGKSETLSTVVAGMMALLPALAEIYPDRLSKFKKGFWVGLFAPVDNQADIIYSRVADKLTSKHAKRVLAEELNDSPKRQAQLLRLQNGSFARRQTCNARAKIEGGTYHITIIDEAQEADDLMVNKSIAPMLASTAGTMVKIGTPSYTKGNFYKSIQTNKRKSTERGGENNHFEYSWKTVAKFNANYQTWIDKEIARLGEDSDEFQMSYNVKWMLDKGMLVTDEQMDLLADKTQDIVTQWFRSACVAGIDVARITDSTVVTVVYVDWDRPDESGYAQHRVLNWLEITNTDWESQYYQIAEFLSNYSIAFVGVDAQGMGGPVAERLEKILGSRYEVVPVTSDMKNQSDRWKHLIQLLQRDLLRYPGSAKAKRTRRWRRFRQQMGDAEKAMKNNFIVVEAPEGRNSHDDYVDSLAIACFMSQQEMVDSVQEFEAPWHNQRQ